MSAHDFEVDGIFYKFLSEEDRTVKVAYNVSYSGNVVIPANVTYEGTTYSVTTIGVEAFYCCNSLTSITIPNSVTTIGNSAFYSCDGLTSITIPNSVTTIGVEAFSNCGSLTSIVVAEDNTIYDSREDCNAIIETATNTLIRGCKNTVIHNSVTTIGERAFDNCRYLTSIVIPNSVTTIGNRAFFSCTGLTSITIPNSVTTIGEWAFYRCTGLTSIEIPNSVTTIGNSAFYRCTGLTSVTSLISANELFSIGNNVFKEVDKNACTLYVPAGAKETYAATEGWNEFRNIVELEYNGQCGENAYWTLQGGVLTISGRGEMYNYSYANTAPWYEYKDVINNIIINDGITTIGNYAFYDCDGLTSIEIPNSVTTIGDDAFYECWNLTSITIPNSVTTIGASAFYWCISLTSIEIPNSVTTIGERAFSSCSGLTSIEIPNSVTSIGYRAFAGCSSLTSMSVAAGHTTYDSRDNCNAIIETATNTLILSCQNTVIPNSVTTIGDNAFAGCSNLTSIEIPNSVTTIGDYAFYSCLFYLTSIEIPNSVTTIGNYAFRDCDGLTSIEIPNSVTTIGERAFGGCRDLTSIVVAEDNTIYDSREHCNAIIETATNTLITGCKNTVIPNSVTTIGDNAFYFCSSLASIEIPNSVTTIGNSAFHGCSGLTSIEIPNSVTTIGDYAFYNCTDLTSIEIPNSVTSIGRSAFSSCYVLTSIEIPNSVTTIGDYTFEFCKSLTSVTIPNSVTSIGYRAFDGCSSLTSITSFIPAEKLFEAGYYVFPGVDKENCTLYVPAGAKETYATTDGWSEFTNIVEMIENPFELTVSAAGYATLYLDYNATIPEGVEAYTASTVDGNRLMMELVTGVLPANTGVIVRAEQGTYTFEQTFEKVDAIESNLLRGSVEDEYITPAKDTKYYVLAMKDGIVGMYADALTGGTFKNNAHKAYLKLATIGIYDEEVDTENSGMQLSNSYYFDFSGTTAIEPVINEVEDNIYYDLSGRRVENPTQGIYIVNGRKVLIK